MTYRRTKRLLAGALAAGLLVLQVPAIALAATDNDAALAARDAIEYLKDTQQTDGNIPQSTDWAVVAIVAGGGDPATVTKNNTSAIDAMKAATPGAIATDLERQVIAINAAGQDSTDFGGHNYNELLAGFHSNNQIGDPTLLNDDIFGIIAIAATQDDSLLNIAQDGLDYLIANQEADGGFSYTTLPCSWDGCSDSDSNDTASALIAFKAASDLGLTNPNLDTAAANALAYLLSTQQADGGFGSTPFSPSDGGSTAWALMVLNTIGDTVKTEASTARDWLLTQQNADHSFSVYYPDFNFTYDFTADSIIALLGTTWLLDPAPLQIPAPTEPTTTPVITTTPTPTAPEQPTNTQPANNDDVEVLAATTTTQNTDQTPVTTPAADDHKDQTTPAAKTSSPASKYVIYAAIALALIGLGWYLFQPKKS